MLVLALPVRVSTCVYWLGTATLLVVHVPLEQPCDVSQRIRYGVPFSFNPHCHNVPLVLVQTLVYVAPFVQL